jgi:hypothetical protein
MNDTEFVNHIVSYVHYYFRNDPTLLEIVAEAVNAALEIKKSTIEEKNETAAA